MVNRVANNFLVQGNPLGRPDMAAFLGDGVPLAEASKGSHLVVVEEFPESLEGREGQLQFFKNQLLLGDYALLHSPSFREFEFQPGELLTLFKEVMECREERKPIVDDLDVLPSSLSEEERLVLSRLKMQRVLMCANHFVPPYSEKWSEYLEKFTRHSVEAKAVMIEAILAGFCQFVADSPPKLMEVLSQIVESVREIDTCPMGRAEKNHLQSRLLDWLSIVALNRESYKGDHTDHASFLSLIAQLRSPEIRQQVTQCWCIYDDRFCQTMASTRIARRFEKKFPFTKLLRFQLSHLKAQFARIPTAADSIERLGRHLMSLKTQKGRKPLFWNVHSFHLLMKTLIVLGRSKFLKMEQKLAILDQLSGQMNIKNAKEILYQLQFLLLTKSDQLGLVNNSFVELIEPVLRERFTLNVQAGKNYFDVIQQCVAEQCRAYPLAIFTYFANLIQLNNPSLEAKFVQRFLSPVLTQTFHETRYDPVDSPQLQALLAIDPHFVTKWSPGKVPKLVPLVTYLDPLHPAPVEGFEIGISDHYSDLMLCTTEVSSCMKVDGNPLDNAALLGFLLHPQTTLVVIKNEEGVIQMRAIVRAMLNQHENEIVLFMEPLYPHNGYLGWKVAVCNFIQAKAEEWGYRIEIDGKKKLKEKLICHPSIADEYCDALQSVVQAGKWLIL